MEVTVPWNGKGPCQSFHMLKNSILTTYRQNITLGPGPPSTCISTISFNSSQGNRTAKADVVSQFVVGAQHQKMCRDKLINVNGGLVAACSNQQGKKDFQHLPYLGHCRIKESALTSKNLWNHKIL